MEIGRNILNHLSQMAANVSEVVDKGKDPQTGAPLRCSPDDIRRYWTPEQSAAIDEFMANFHIEPEQPSRPPPPEGRSKKAKGRS